MCRSTDNSKLKDGFKSLPSGHSSIAFASFFFLSLWMAGQLGVFNPQVKINSSGTSLKGLICMFPMAIASFVAISRTEDYRHRGTDIIAGALLGIIISWGSYRIFFPALTSSASNTPYILQENIKYQDSDLPFQENPVAPDSPLQDSETATSFMGSSSYQIRNSSNQNTRVSSQTRLPLSYQSEDLAYQSSYTPSGPSQIRPSPNERVPVSSALGSSSVSTPINKTPLIGSSTISQVHDDDDDDINEIGLPPNIKNAENIELQEHKVRSASERV